MRTSVKTHARLRWIPSFVAFCNTANLTRAAAEIDVSENTIKNHVLALERWTSRYLLDENDDGPYPTVPAYKYMPDMTEALHLIVSEDINKNIQRATVCADGFYHVNGKRVRSVAGGQIGNILFRMKADLRKSIPHVAPPKISGSAILMDWYSPNKTSKS